MLGHTSLTMLVTRYYQYVPNLTRKDGTLLAKWLVRQPRVLILVEPTRGMDVGAKDEVLETIQHLRDQGVAVLLISSEPETIIANSDRTLVMSKGRITKEFADEEVTKAALLRSA